MKRILLASVSVVAFAGAAAAEVSFGGDAEIGFNDEFEDGIFWSVGATLTGTMELDYGLTAGITLDVDIVENGRDDGDANLGTFEGFDIGASDYVLSLTSDMGGLYFGDTDTAAQALWSGVTNMDADSFSENDDLSDDEGVDAVLRGEVMYGPVTAAVSYGVQFANDGGDDGDDLEDGTADDELDYLSIAAAGEFGAFTFSGAYQDDTNPTGEVMAIAAGGSFAGADVTLAYASEDIGSVESIGLEVSYPLGPVTLTAFYVMQEADFDIDDNYGVEASYANGPITVDARYHDGNDEDMAIEATYDVGNGLSVFAGYIDEGETGASAGGPGGVEQATFMYVGGEFDIGGGASVLVSYVDTEAGDGGSIDSDLDDIGAQGLRTGTTVMASFDF